jgi:predicted DNA-binding transcriptional regulator AlpA
MLVAQCGARDRGSLASQADGQQPVDSTPEGTVLPLNRMISIWEVAKVFGLGRTAAYKLTRRSDFPRPIVISPRCYRWPEAEVAAFAETLRKDAGQRCQPASGRSSRDGGRRGDAVAGRISGTVRPVRARRQDKPA